MPPALKLVGTQGYTPVPPAPPEAEAPGHTGGPPPAQMRASDIPPSAAAHGPDGAETAEPVDISKARSVPQTEQTHAQREAKKATAEKPSFLKKIFAGIAGAISGGIGLAASGNINPDGAFPSMFEPVHGSAPDIAGQQKADPTAAILSTALLLDHLGMPEPARRIEAAVTADLADRDGATRSTSATGDAIRARL